MDFKFLILALSISTTIILSPIYGQITTPCTPSMITSFSPCMNFVTNSTNTSLNGTTPTADCCGSLKSLMTSGKDCLCLLVRGSVPFRIPINRTLAISLPRSCNTSGVPLQCKLTVLQFHFHSYSSPPLTGPMANGPSMYPNAAPPPSVQEVAPRDPLSPTSSPGGDETQPPPAATTNGARPPTSNTGSSRAGVTDDPSAATPTCIFSSLQLVMAAVGAIAFRVLLIDA
ncbi:hypothetical protein OROMI_005748 [Orobanche minor]